MISPTTFSAKDSFPLSLKDNILQPLISFPIGLCSWTGEAVSILDLTSAGINWYKLCTGALRLFDFCLCLKRNFLDRSERCCLVGVPWFTRLSKTLLSGRLAGVTKAATCQSMIIQVKCCVYAIRHMQFYSLRVKFQVQKHGSIKKPYSLVKTRTPACSVWLNVLLTTSNHQQTDNYHRQTKHSLWKGIKTEHVDSREKWNKRDCKNEAKRQCLAGVHISSNEVLRFSSHKDFCEWDRLK